MYEFVIRRKDLSNEQFLQIYKHWEIIVADPELQRKFYPWIKTQPRPNVLPFSAMPPVSNENQLRPWDEWFIYEEYRDGGWLLRGECRYRNLRLVEFMRDHLDILPKLIRVVGDGYDKWPEWKHAPEEEYRDWYPEYWRPSYNDDY